VSAYVIVTISVKDPVAYEEYKPLALASVTRHGGRYLVRAGRIETLEGEPPGGRVVILEFPSFDQAMAWYDSDDYRECATIRWDSATSSLFVVEGIEEAAG
jgi:uncharacterized protein (DUF1330 family)